MKTLLKFTALIAALALVLFVWNKLADQALTATDEATQASLPKRFIPLQRPVPDFELTERSGQPFKLADLKGKVWIANLIFTSCPDACPILSASMSKLEQELADLPNLRLVSFTITPEYDTPERLREYATRFGASDRWFFLTGSRETIVKVANDGFLLSAGTEGTVTHSEKFVLIDQRGAARGLFDSTQPESLRELVSQARQLAGEAP